MSSPFDYTTGIKYVIYKCNTCNRSIDVLQDNLRVFVNKCSITQFCKGKLLPISTKTTRSVLAASENTFLQDRISQSTLKFDIPDVTYQLNSEKNITTIAVKKTGTLPSSFLMKFNINSSISSYRELNFPKSDRTILGTDSSGNVLRFTHNDTVLVYVNGVLLHEHPTSLNGYVLGYNGELGYSVTLNNYAVFAQNNVRIIIYTPTEIQYSNNIEFKDHSFFSHNNAWSNVTDVKINGEDYRLFSTNELNLLPLNTRLNLFPGDNAIDISHLYFLMANPNYTCVDRNLVNVVNMNNLSSNENYLNISVQNADYVLQCSSTSVETINPIGKISIIDNSLETTTNLTSVSNASLINNDIASNIIGVI